MTQRGSIVGTVAYMSPEQARGEELDARSDLFSLGAVLYEMVTGHVAFSGDASAIIFDAILNRNPIPAVRLNPRVPPKLEEIIDKLLEKDRKLRYQGAADVAADLKRLQRDSDASGSVLNVATAETSDKRGSKTKLLIIAASVLIAAVIIAMLFRSPRASALNERDFILLEDFINRTGDSAFDGTLKQALAVQLAQSPFLNIFPEDRIRETLRYMARSPDEPVTDSIAREICQREGLRAVLGGSIAPLGTHYVISLEAVNCATGESLAREQRESDSKEHVLTELGHAASSLRATFGESLASIQKFDTPIERATTSSLEALRAYTEGRKLLSAGDHAKAIVLAQRAVELDPNFASAHRLMGVAYGNLRQTQMARESTAKAFALRDRVSEPERLSITAFYYFTAVGDVNKTIETYELWKQIYPRDFTAWLNLGVQYSVIGRSEDALSNYQEGSRLRANNTIARLNVGDALQRLNRFEETKAVYKSAMDEKLEMFEMHYNLYEIAFAEGDAQSMQNELDWAKKNMGRAVLYIQARAAASSGKMAEARRFFKQSIDMARLEGANERAADAGFQEAAIEARFGNARQARTRVEELLQLGHSLGEYSVPAYTALGFAAEPQAVKEWTDEMKSDLPQHTLLNFVWVPSALAALELRAGNAASAVDLLEAAKSYEATESTFPVMYTRGLAYLHMKSGPEAAAEFQKILDHRGVAPLSPEYRLARLGLGRAYALEGDLVNARRAYEDFLASWKDADSDIPILIEAKQEFAKLPRGQ